MVSWYFFKFLKNQDFQDFGDHVANLGPWLARRWSFLRRRYFYKPILFIMTEVGKLWNWEMNCQSIEKNWRNRAGFTYSCIVLKCSTSPRLTAYYSYRAFVNEKYAQRVIVFISLNLRCGTSGSTLDAHMIIPEALKWTLKSAEKWPKKYYILTSCCQPWAVAISTLRLSPDEIFLWTDIVYHDGGGKNIELRNEWSEH